MTNSVEENKVMFLAVVEKRERKDSEAKIFKAWTFLYIFVYSLDNLGSGILTWWWHGLLLQEGAERELLQQQLQEANRRAQEYRHQLLKKEQEAEQYRLKLEAMARQQPNGVDFTMVEEVAEVDAVVVTEGEMEERDMAVTGAGGTIEPHPAVSLETVSS